MIQEEDLDMMEKTQQADCIAENKLRQMINDAKTCLEGLRPYTTHVAQLALEDMIQQAEAVVNQGENDKNDESGLLPFTTKREFGDWHWNKEDACQFAAKRYTMASVWFEPGKAYSTYGLEDALAWFQTQDLRKPLAVSEIEKDNDSNLSGKFTLSMAETCEYYEKKCREFLANVTYGDSIGQYSKSAGEALLQALNQLTKIRKENTKKTAENSVNPDDTTIIAQALAACLNALWELRTSRVLRSEINLELNSESGGNLLLSAAQMEEICHKIESDPLTKSQYEQIKALADSASLEQRKSAYRALFAPSDDYEQLNREFVIKTNADNRPSFAIPKGTVSASFALRLPREDNERDGLGHIQVWNIGLKASEGENIHLDIETSNSIENLNSIENSNSIATSNRTEANEKVKTDKESSGRVTLCNPTSDHEDVWTYDKEILLRDDAIYTVMFDAKQDGKFKTGMQIEITFFDKNGKELGTYAETFNRKAWLNTGLYNLYTQCDAICYWYTKDPTYAEKSKIEMLHFLDDFCQGAHHWLRYNERPEGSDAYGGVQGGRILFTIAVAYSMIRDSGVWSKKETDRFYGLVSYMLRYLADLRDRTLLTKERAQRGSSNWQTDMHIGAAAIMMAIPDFPNRKLWMYNSEAVLRAQLDYKLNADGSWPESLRYHFASLEHFSLYARLWERESGENWFVSKNTDMPGLLDMFRYPLYTQTPPYAYFNDCIATPPFGDHKLGNGSEFALYGLYCDQVAQYDKDTAQKMYATWCRAKKPVKAFWGESVTLENLMYPSTQQNGANASNLSKTADLVNSADSTNQADGHTYGLDLTSCASFPDSGIYVFRDHFGTPQENYLAVMSSPKKIGHGHKDQGAFIYYYHCIPVIMDSGIEGYFEASTPWHICSYSHAVMQFEAAPHGPIKKTAGFINLNAGTYSLERGWNDEPDCSKVTQLCLRDKTDEKQDEEKIEEQTSDKSDSCESISMEIKNPMGDGIQHRTITIDHLAETVTIQDTVTDFSGQVLFNFPILAKSAVQNENEILADGYYGVKIKITIYSKAESVVVEPGRATPMAPDANDHTDLLYLRIKAKAEDGVAITIAPNK